MMGSVYERFREIGVYSSVGLAPAHISFLFLAEACVYAVLSVVFGYLLGQGTVKVLRFVFPFTVNETNVDSLCGYLYSQYASYNDESVGGFYAEQTRIVTRQVVNGPLQSVQLGLWLAPFDLGVSQYLEISVYRSATTAIHEVEVFVERLSGPMAHWHRLNQDFALKLRRQFLI